MIKKLIALLSILVPASALEAGPYKPDSGPLQVSFEQVSIDAGGRMLSMRIAFPTDGGMYPVVILSHGGGCAGGSYQVVSDHWASHGYMVIQPTHPDSVSVGFDMAALDPRQMEGIVGQRVEDMSLVLDALSDLETMFPSLAGKMDVERLVAAGHSMGGATALLATGLVLENPFSKRKTASSEDRYDALLLLSEPGRNPTLPDEPWRSIDLPTFIYTGTNDYGSESGEGSNIPFQYTIMNDKVEPPPPKHYLWVDDVNHDLSGAWCRDPLASDYDVEAVAILRGVSTAFLDAYTKRDQAALDFLNTEALPDAAGSRPTLSRP